MQYCCGPGLKVLVMSTSSNGRTVKLVASTFFNWNTNLTSRLGANQFLNAVKVHPKSKQGQGHNVLYQRL